MNESRFNPSRRHWLQGTGVLLLGAGAWRMAAATPQEKTAAATRVIVIGGALAEVTYALGRENTLVGSDTTCTFPEAARKLPKVGYQRALSAEGLLSLRPSLILTSEEAGPTSVLQRVRDNGVRVETFAEQHNVASVRNKITGVAAALAAEAEGQALLARFDQAWSDARSPTPGLQDLRVVFLLSPPGVAPMVAGRHTAADAMIHYAGARNAMEGFSGYRPLSPEALVSASPDVVLTTEDTLHQAGGSQALLRQTGFALTPAGRHGRVAALDALFMLGFGPRLPEAVLALRKGLTRQVRTG